jgi:lysozyme family protein
MKHPFEVLKPEYSRLLAAVEVRDDRKRAVDEVAVKLCGYKTRYQPVADLDGVPIVFIATSFQREASSNFMKNPAQGWPLRSISKWEPHNGPFPDWKSAALAAYHLNGLDRVGKDNWTWELICFYGEMFNGFGYRDFHGMHSPYLWGGTNVQTIGKYTSDGHFDPEHWDEQLGIVPVARRMVELDPSLALPKTPYVPAPPVKSGLATSADHPDADARWVQAALNELGHEPPLAVDGSYGRRTGMAVQQFQRSYGLEVDGLAGPKTIAGLRAALDALKAEPSP